MKFGRILLILGIAALVGAWFVFKSNTPNDLPDDGFLKIPTGYGEEQTANLLAEKGFISNKGSFEWWATRMDFKPRAGRYKIESGWSNMQLIRHLRSGNQVPVKVVLNNEKTVAQVAAKVGKVLEADSAALMQTFSNAVLLDSLGFNPNNLMTLFIPNTYEYNWNTSPRAFLERLLKEHKRFWNNKRLEQAAALHLSPAEVYTMASIVEGETNKIDERRKVAGAYLNRLKTNMRLQADPTVQFAIMQREGTSTFRRLYNVDYQTPHPYNTYLKEGLPPGPIGMASIPSIEGVLQPEPHNYVYFCAKPDNSGYHNFAETYEAHLVNVKIYQNWLASIKK
jgi:UPF0755 protein